MTDKSHRIQMADPLAYFRAPDRSEAPDFTGLKWYCHMPAGELQNPYAPMANVTNRKRSSSMTTEPASISVSVVCPDASEEAEAEKELSGSALAAWRRAEPRRALSHALKKMRGVKGLSQREIAEAIGVKQSDIARMESAAGPWPNQSKLAAYAEVCGMRAVVGFIGMENDELDLQVVSLGGSFGEQPEETLSADELDLANARRGKFYE